MARISDNPLVPLKQTPENVLTPSVALINNPLDKWKKSLFYIRQEKIFPAKANWLKKKKFRHYRGINFRERKNTIVSKKNRFMHSMMLPAHCLGYQLGKKKKTWQMYEKISMPLDILGWRDERRRALLWRILTLCLHERDQIW